ncbi:MAG: cytochrome b N-terminal domain-containing protein [Acidobacteria bacterium]|nr:cytochrome b N-terminal domain-containing protein [Acidobacteriota bacterium]
MNLSAITTWVNDRAGLEPLRALAHKKTVPLHRHSVWYYFGGMTLFLFAIQVGTGILLLLYYRPSAENAFESVQFIMTEVRFGWLVRSIHSWSANLMIATMFVHMFSAYLMKAYRPPRELTWVSGTLLLFIVLGFGFSGYLLPWNKLAFFATKVGTDIAGVVPGIGTFLLRFLRGGDEVTGATLTRFYGFHVAVLPALVTAILFVHLYFVQQRGMSVPPSLAGKPLQTMKFVPNFFLRDLMGWLLALGALAALAALFPWELGEKADAFASAPAGIKPEWFFVFMFQTLKYLPAKIGAVDGEVLGILAFGGGGLFWLLVPFLDRQSAQGKSSRWFTLIGILILLYIVGMTIVGYAE